MQVNPAPHMIALLAWSGTTARVIDTINYNDFGFVFQIDTTLTADTVFQVQHHDSTGADACAPDVAQNTQTINTCNGGAFTPADMQITLPNGTVAGTVIACALPCRAGRFISVAADSGDTANVTGVVTLVGPRS